MTLGVRECAGGQQGENARLALHQPQTTDRQVSSSLTARQSLAAAFSSSSSETGDILKGFWLGHNRGSDAIRRYTINTGPATVTSATSTPLVDGGFLRRRHLAPVHGEFDLSPLRRSDLGLGRARYNRSNGIDSKETKDR